MSARSIADPVEGTAPVVFLGDERSENVHWLGNQRCGINGRLGAANPHGTHYGNNPEYSKIAVEIGRLHGW